MALGASLVIVLSRSPYAAQSRVLYDGNSDDRPRTTDEQTIQASIRPRRPQPNLPN